MFCSNCGKEIKVNSNFCEFCGHEVKKIITEEKTQSKVNTRKKKVFIVGAIVIAVVMISIVFVMEMHRVTTKNKALEDAKLFMEEKEYESAIEAFDRAFAEGDNDPQHYLLQAKAYVESGDLYAAQQTLQLGYANTKSEDLLYVEIWGPAQPFDLYYYVENNWSPTIRQKYIFDENKITSQHIQNGKVLLSTNYYYDEYGQLIGTQIYNCWIRLFGGGNLSDLDTNLGSCIPMELAEIDECYDFVYSENDTVEVWMPERILDIEGNRIQTAERKLVATLYYENSRCEYIKSERGETDFSYNDKGNIVSITSTEGSVIEVEYLDDKGCIIKKDDDNYVWEFNSDGLNCSYYGNLVDTREYVNIENGCITEIIQENVAYRLFYDRAGRVAKIEWRDKVKQVLTAICTYNEKEQLSKIEFEFEDKVLTRTFYYDEEGRIRGVYEADSSLEFVYDDNGVCINYTWIQENGNTVIHTMAYDDLGRVIGTIIQ